MTYWPSYLSYMSQYYTGGIKPESEANAKFQPKRSTKIKNKRKKKKK